MKYLQYRDDTGFCFNDARDIESPNPTQAYELQEAEALVKRFAGTNPNASAGWVNVMDERDNVLNKLAVTYF